MNESGWTNLKEWIRMIESEWMNLTDEWIWLMNKFVSEDDVLLELINLKEWIWMNESEGMSLTEWVWMNESEGMCLNEWIWLMNEWCLWRRWFSWMNEWTYEWRRWRRRFTWKQRESLLLYLDSMFMLVALYLPGNSSNNQIALVGVVISCELLN